MQQQGRTGVGDPRNRISRLHAAPLTRLRSEASSIEGSRPCPQGSDIRSSTPRASKTSWLPRNDAPKSATQGSDARSYARAGHLGWLRPQGLIVSTTQGGTARDSPQLFDPPGRCSRRDLPKPDPRAPCRNGAGLSGVPIAGMPPRDSHQRPTRCSEPRLTDNRRSLRGGTHPTSRVCMRATATARGGPSGTTIPVARATADTRGGPAGRRGGTGTRVPTYDAPGPQPRRLRPTKGGGPARRRRHEPRDCDNRCVAF